MSAFAIPLVFFTAGLVWLLVEMIRGSIEDEVPLRAGVTWAVTCPLAGLLFGVGLAPVAFVVGAVSVLALGSLAFWFVGTEPGDSDDPPADPIEPDPSPIDEIDPEPDLVPEVDPEPGLDWDAFDPLREEWEKKQPAPVTEPERVPAGV